MVRVTSSFVQNTCSGYLSSTSTHCYIVFSNISVHFGTWSEEVRHPCAFHVIKKNYTQCTILYGSVGVECKNNDVRRTDVVPPLVHGKESYIFNQLTLFPGQFPWHGRHPQTGWLSKLCLDASSYTPCYAIFDLYDGFAAYDQFPNHVAYLHTDRDNRQSCNEPTKVGFALQYHMIVNIIISFGQISWEISSRLTKRPTVRYI